MWIRPGRSCATAPNCGLYSLLLLRPGGPRALRTPSELDGVEGLSTSEAIQLQESSLLVDRCAECACITHLSGGHAHIEQPSGAMSWREPMAQKWMLQSSCNFVLVAACEYGLEIAKNWLFASSYTELIILAKQCVMLQIFTNPLLVFALLTDPFEQTICRISTTSRISYGRYLGTLALCRQRTLFDLRSFESGAGNRNQ